MLPIRESMGAYSCCFTGDRQVGFYLQSDSSIQVGRRFLFLIQIFSLPLVLA